MLLQYSSRRQRLQPAAAKGVSTAFRDNEHAGCMKVAGHLKKMKFAPG
jgi:hypothetical protein